LRGNTSRRTLPVMPGFVILLLIIVGSLLVAALVGVGLLWWRMSRAAPGDSLQLLQQQVLASAEQQDRRLAQLGEQLGQALQHLTTNLTQHLTRNLEVAQQSQKTLSERLDAAGRTIGDLKGQLGELGQATQNILKVGSEVRRLQDVLQSPKLRGGLGEWSLENLLAEVLPTSHYALQYRFRNGTVVDALVRLAQGNVCIDAKFPLTNFQAMLAAPDDEQRSRVRKAFLRDVCRRVDEIAEKYILPDEGTLDFALMYIPAENVYYEIVLSAGGEPDVTAHARGRRVVPVSPNTLYAYLMVIAAGLKGLQIERNAQRIRRQLGRLGGEVGGIQQEVALVGKHLNNAVMRQAEVTRRVEALARRLSELDTAAAAEEAAGET